MSGEPAPVSVAGPRALPARWTERLASLTSWLGLAEGEGGRALRLLGLIFSASASLVLIKAAQSGVFLAAYPRSMIPWAFVASAITLASFSALSVALAARVGPVALGSSTLVLASAALVATRALVALGVPHAPFVVYVVVEAIAGLVLIQVWSVVSETVDPRSAKRLLPLAGIGASLAWCFGGLLVPRVVAIVGAYGLLLVAPVLMLIAFAIVRAIARIDLGGRPARGAARVGLLEGWKSGLAFVAEVPLMRVILALSVLALIGEQLMDYQLMAAAQQRHQSPAQIAAFYGRFYGVTSGISMLLLGGASARILSRLGAMLGLVATPVLTVLAAVLALAVPGFGPAVILRGVDRVMKPALWSSAVEQTQTPLPVVRRAQARALVRGVVAPLFYGLAALGLAAMPATADLRVLALLTLLVSVAMTTLIVVSVRRRYVQALRAAIDDRRLRLDHDAASAQGATFAVDVDACEALGRELLDPDESRALLAAEILGHGEGPAAIRALARGLVHPVPQVRTEIATALGRLGAIGEISALTTLLLRDPISDVRRAVARSLRALGEKGVRDQDVRMALETAQSDTDRGVRAVCRVTLLEWDDPRGVENGTALVPLLSAEDPDACEIALSALDRRAFGNEAVIAVVRDLLRGGHRTLRLAALEAVARSRVRALLADCAPLLEDARTAPEAVAHLTRWGEGALETASESVAMTTDASGPLGAPSTVPSTYESSPVSRLLSHADVGVRQRATAAILRAKKKPRMPRAAVEPLLHREIERAYHLAALRVGIENDDDPGNDDLSMEIELRFRDAKHQILQLLAILESKKLAAIAQVGFRKTLHGQKPGHVEAQVAELLEIGLPAPLARKVVPLFERATPKERVEAGRRIGIAHDSAVDDPLGALVALDDAHLRGFALAAFPKFGERFPEIHATESVLVPIYERMRFLRSVPLFGELPGEDLRTIAEIVETVEHARGAVVFHKGDAGDDLYVILRGRIVIRDGKTELATLGPREFFGELAVIDREPRNADAVALEDSQLLRLRGADLTELMHRRPQIQEQFLRVLARRLREVTLRVATQ